MDSFLLAFGEFASRVHRGLLEKFVFLDHLLHLDVIVEQVLHLRHLVAGLILDIIVGVLVPRVESPHDVFPVEEHLRPNHFLMLSEQADELPNCVPLLELLLLLFEVEAPLVVYRALVEVEEVLAEVAFEDALEPEETLLKSTHRLCLYLLHGATTTASLAEGILLVVLLVLLMAIGLELLLDNSLLSIGFDPLHVGHVQQ